MESNFEDGRKSYSASIHNTFTLPENAAEICSGFKVYSVDVEGRRNWSREEDPRIICHDRIIEYRNSLRGLGIVIAFARDYRDDNSKHDIRIYERCLEEPWCSRKVEPSGSRSIDDTYLSYTKPVCDMILEIKAREAKIWREALEMGDIEHYLKTFAKIDPITYKAFLTEDMLKPIK